MADIKQHFEDCINEITDAFCSTYGVEDADANDSLRESVISITKTALESSLYS